MTNEILRGDKINFISFTLEILRKERCWNAMSHKISIDGRPMNTFRFCLEIKNDLDHTVDEDPEKSSYVASASIGFCNSNHSYRNSFFDVILNMRNAGFGFSVRLNKCRDNFFSIRQFSIFLPILLARVRYQIQVRIYFNASDLHLEKNLLSNDLKRLLASEKHVDLKLKVDDKTFNVHKAILSSRSKVLEKMIESEMMEKKTGEIKLHDTDPAAVAELLEYLYTEKSDVSKSTHELFKLAHFLELSDLQLQCKHYLLDNINQETIVDTLILTNNHEQYELSDVKVRAMKFVEDNESMLIESFDFQQYLISTICLGNLVLVLRLANTYQSKDLLRRAVEFVRSNCKEVFENAECKKFLSEHGELMIEIYKQSWDMFNCNEVANESKSDAEK